MDLAKELARRAKKDGICKPWYNELKSLQDKKAMIEMYLKGIDFCLANDYPGNDFIRKHFKGEMESFGVFLDDEIDIENKRKCVCLGMTSGRIVVSGFKTCEIFVKHNAKLDIYAKDNAFVIIDVFDNSEVRIHANDRAKVCVNRYIGNNAGIKDEADEAFVKIREKQKKTY